MKYCLCVDGSDHSASASRFVMSLLKPGDSVVLASAHRSKGDHSKDALERHETVKSCQEITAPFLANENIKASVDTIAYDSSISASITEYANGKFDIVAMGTRGLGTITKALLGSVSNAVVHSITDSMVLVVPSSVQPQAKHRVLMCSDGSEPALRCTAAIAHLLNDQDEIVLVSVYESHSTPDHVALLKVKAQHGINLARETLQLRGFAGQVSEALLPGGTPGSVCNDFMKQEAKAGRRFNMIGVGSRGLGRADRMYFGSSTDTILNNAKVAVLVSH